MTSCVPRDHMVVGSTLEYGKFFIFNSKGLVYIESTWSLPGVYILQTRSLQLGVPLLLVNTWSLLGVYMEST